MSGGWRSRWAERPRRVSELQVRIGTTSMTKRGAARFDWRDPYHFAIEIPWRGFVLAVLTIYVLLNLAFGTLYALDPGSVANLPRGSFLNAVFFSIETLATVGYGVMAPQSLYGHLVASFEIVVGMCFTAVTTGLLFVRFARPRSRILFARRCVIARRNGRPCLMVRVGNGRAASLTHGFAQISALIPEYTQEGQMFRRFHELRLERASIPLFALTWTLMHEIGAGSPLAGYDSEALARDRVRLFVSVQARDPVLAGTVVDMQDYDADTIAFGMRYADAIIIAEDGSVTADLTRLHELEPEEVVVEREGD